MGWSPAQLAAILQRSTSSLNRTMTRDRVTTSTAAKVSSLFGELWNQIPPVTTPTERSSILRIRAVAAQRHWLPALAWDDIDEDACPPSIPPIDPSYIDEIAIERASDRDGLRFRDLSPAEQFLLVNRLTAGGASIRDISDRLATTTRTVSRRRNPDAA